MCMLLSGVKLKHRNLKKFFLSYMFEGIRIVRYGQNRKTQLLKLFWKGSLKVKALSELLRQEERNSKLDEL